MRRDNTEWRPAAAAQLHWDEGSGPVSTRFGDIYYSREDGLRESHYVFLQGNNLPARWSEHTRPHFCIGETGFGTGLNFLLTWQAWRELPEPRPDLHYLSIEKFPLSRQDLNTALAAWKTLIPLGAELLSHYPGLVPGQHRLLLEDGRVRLDLWWEDVTDALPDLASRAEPLVDAWYLDGFAPAINESMWSDTVLQAVAALSRPNASFATFTAAGRVRRDLERVGFDVVKAPGFGRKRECLRGQLRQTPGAPTAGFDTPWDISNRRTPRPDRVLIVGAGLAGCTVAAALAQRGVAVTLLDQANLAGAGSGNEQGILYTRLSRKHSALTDFALQSFCFASSYYRGLFDRDSLAEGLDGALCGSFHQSSNTVEMATLGAALATVPELAQVLGPEQAKEVLGVEQSCNGYWFPRSGWLRPISVCRSLVDNSGIELIENCGQITLSRSAGQWHAASERGEVAAAPCAVVACGTATSHMPQLAWLPLQPIRGQTTHLPTTESFAQLRAALCHDGYIAPARLGNHCIGATFDVGDDDSNLRTQDHISNIGKLADALPAWRESLTRLDSKDLDGRVGHRCASPDYLPMVGPVPDRNAFLRDYGALRKNARQAIASKGDYMPGLYLSTAHGSRGLSSTPIAAELLASMICGEPVPLSRELCRALAPARFLLRDLARNRI